MRSGETLNGLEMKFPKRVVLFPTGIRVEVVMTGPPRPEDCTPRDDSSIRPMRHEAKLDRVRITSTLSTIVHSSISTKREH